MFAGVVGLALDMFQTMLVTHNVSVWSTGINVKDQTDSFAQVISQGAATAASGKDYNIALNQDDTVLTMGKNFKARLTSLDRPTISEQTFSTHSNCS